jgi:hypothetical protein
MPANHPSRSKPLVRPLVALALSLMLASPAFADIPDDKTGRIQEFREREITLSEPASGSYQLFQGTRRIGDLTLAETVKDEELVGQLRGDLRRRALWQLGWTALIPVGGFVFYDNFYGSERAPTSGLPPARFAPFPATDFKAFLLTLAGGAIATYGAVNASQWLSERMGWFIPQLLKPEVAKEKVQEARTELLDELNLLAADVPIATGGATASAVSPQDATLLPGNVPAGGEGSAAYYAREATKVITSQKGPGYRLYLVYTADLTDTTGVIQRGAWNYLFTHPTKLDAWEVSVPIFGGNPTVRQAPAAYNAYKEPSDFPGTWRIDSPAAMTSLKDALIARGEPWLTEDATFALLPYFELLRVPVWILDLGDGPLTIGVEAASGSVVGLRESSLNPITGGAQSPAGRR